MNRRDFIRTMGVLGATALTSSLYSQKTPDKSQYPHIFINSPISTHDITIGEPINGMRGGHLSLQVQKEFQDYVKKTTGVDSTEGAHVSALVSNPCPVQAVDIAYSHATEATSLMKNYFPGYAYPEWVVLTQEQTYITDPQAHGKAFIGANLRHINILETEVHGKTIGKVITKPYEGIYHHGVDEENLIRYCCVNVGEYFPTTLFSEMIPFTTHSQGRSYNPFDFENIQAEEAFQESTAYHMGRELMEQLGYSKKMITALSLKMLNTSVYNAKKDSRYAHAFDALAFTGEIGLEKAIELYVTSTPKEYLAHVKKHATRK